MFSCFRLEQFDPEVSEMYVAINSEIISFCGLSKADQKTKLFLSCHLPLTQRLRSSLETLLETLLKKLWVLWLRDQKFAFYLCGLKAKPHWPELWRQGAWKVDGSNQKWFAVKPNTMSCFYFQFDHLNFGWAWSVWQELCLPIVAIREIRCLQGRCDLQKVRMIK